MRRPWISASVVARAPSIAASLRQSLLHVAGERSFRTVDPIMAMSPLVDGALRGGRNTRCIQSPGRRLLHVGGAQVKARRLSAVLGCSGEQRQLALGDPDPMA